jgi:hypothetical protein
MARVLIIDIENTPSLAYVWKFWQENVSPKQVKEHAQLMSASWKWLGEEEVFYVESRKGNERKLIKPILEALDEADIVVAHNAKKHDLPVINARALVHGFTPPSPYKVVDTLLEARKNFKFGQNSLEYLAKILGCSPKMESRKFPGFELWKQCLLGNPEAWEEMRVYNIQDVITLEEVYLKLRPWMSQHPNVAIYNEGDQVACPKCGGTHIQFRGHYKTSVSKFKRFRCVSCGSWGRLRKNELDKSVRESLGMAVAS